MIGHLFVSCTTAPAIPWHSIHSVIKSRQCVRRPVKILLRTSGKSQRCSRASTGNGERRMPFQSDSHYLETCTPSALHHQSGVVFSQLPVCVRTKPVEKGNLQNLVVFAAIVLSESKRAGLTSMHKQSQRT